jgi:hypothetical protein
MAHIYLHVPDELYERMQAVAWRANVTVAELASSTLETAFSADVVLDARPTAASAPSEPLHGIQRQPVTAGGDLVWAFDAAVTPGDPAPAVSQRYERYFLDWEVELPAARVAVDERECQAP